MKKLEAVLVIGLMAAGAVFSNGASDSSASGPVTIELWYGAAMTEAGPPPADWPVLERIKEELGIDLKISALPSNESDQDVKVQAAGAANALPDLFMVRRDPWLNLIKANLIAPVDDMYKLMPNRSKLHYDADSRKFTTVNGKSYGLASPGSVAKNEGVLIRKDWLDKLRLQVPVTTEDYLNVMRAFTTGDPDGNGRDDTYGYGAFIEINNFEEGLGRRLDPFMGAFGVAGTWDLNRKTAGLNVRKSEYYDGLAYIKRIIDEKLIDPNWISYKKDDFRAAWKQGRFGIIREQNAAFAAEANYAPFDKNFPAGEWIVIDPPKGSAGKQSVGVYTNAYRIYAVSQKAARAGKGPAIARLLEWMSSDEGYYLLGWGERGVNYTLDADGVPTVDNLPNAALAFTRGEGQVVTQLRNLVFYNGDVEMKARLPTYKAAYSGKIMSAFAVQKDMQSRPWTAAVGADALPSPGVDLRRFYEQGVIEFVTGQRQLNRTAWAAWLAEFDKLGGVEWEKAGIEEARKNGYLR